MSSSLSRAVIARRAILITAAIPVIVQAGTIRIVSYNTQGDVSTPAPTTVLPNLETVFEGIAQERYTGDKILKLPDILALQETTSNSTTVTPIVTALNSYFNHPNLYSSSSYQGTESNNDPTVGNGPNALIYNQTTLNLMASVGVGTPTGASDGEYRQVVRYEFQPIIDTGTSNGIFYVYDQHAKSLSSGTQSVNQTYQQEEATIIRNDEATLPANSSVLYVGDWNVNASTDPSMNEMTSAGQGQAIDALNPNNNPQNWQKSSSYLTVLSDSVATLDYRDDIEFMTGNILNGSSGSLTYIPSSLHVFANNGSTGVGANINSTANTALNDLVGPLTPATVLAAMNKSIGSDHLPVVSDYTVAGYNNGIWIGGAGTWSNSTYWTNEAIPNTSSIEVKIDNGNSIASVVTLDQNATIADVTVDANDTLNISSGETLSLVGTAASAFNGTFTNAGTISAGVMNNTGSFTSTGTFSATGNFNNSGTVSLGGTQNWVTGNVFTNTAGAATFNTDAGSVSKSVLSVNVSGGSVMFTSTQHLAGLNISGGGLATVARNSSGGRSVLVVSNPGISGTLDLTSNDLDAAATSLATITGLIKTGYSTGTTGPWTGKGITSSTAAASSTHLMALGVIQNNQSGSALFTAGRQFDGVTPGTTDILVRYTYTGDANLDGKVDASD